MVAGGTSRGSSPTVFDRGYAPAKVRSMPALAPELRDICRIGGFEKISDDFPKLKIIIL